MMPTIRTIGLTKRYGRVVGLDNLNLEVQEGEVVGFLGPNGSGKTTTIRLLLDLIRPTAGSASIGGFDCHRESLRARELVGYLPGEMPIYPELAGHAYLSYLGRLGATPPDPATLEALCRRFGVGRPELDRPLRDLSHGTKRKLGIVQALMARPRVAILDEPTNGLDPLMIEAFAGTIDDLKREGRTTVFLSSHVLSEVERCCDRVAVVKDGRLIQTRTLDEIARSMPRRVTIRFSRPAGETPAPQGLPPAPQGLPLTPQGLPFEVAGVRVVSQAADCWVLDVEGPLGPVLEGLRGLPVADVDAPRPSLNDYVLGLYGDRR